MVCELQRSDTTAWQARTSFTAPYFEGVAASCSADEVQHPIASFDVCARFPSGTASSGRTTQGGFAVSDARSCAGQIGMADHKFHCFDFQRHTFSVDHNGDASHFRSLGNRASLDAVLSRLSVPCALRCHHPCRRRLPLPLPQLPQLRRSQQHAHAGTHPGGAAASQHARRGLHHEARGGR